MDTSYVEYKNYGFWTRDSFLSEWLQSMIVEMQASPQPEPWLQPLIEHWKIQSKIDGGCMSLDLDEFLTDETRRKLILQFAQKAVLRSNRHQQENGTVIHRSPLGNRQHHGLQPNRLSVTEQPQTTDTLATQSQGCLFLTSN